MKPIWKNMKGKIDWKKYQRGKVSEISNLRQKRFIPMRVNLMA